MKSLYESLLNNTHGGIKATIEDWCKEYIPIVKYHINSKDEICGNNKLEFDEKKLYESDEDLPDAIKFGDMPNGTFTATTKINDHPKKFPGVIYTLIFDMAHTNTIKDLDIGVINKVTFNYPQNLTHIENWKINNNNRDNGYILNFNLTSLPFKDLKELDCPGYTGLDLSGTPCGKELWGKLKTRLKKSGDTQAGTGWKAEEDIAEMLDELFEKLPDVRYISVTPRRSLERVGGHWYINLFNLSPRRTPLKY